MALEHLVILTRFPEAGQVKTRLIPGLGVEAATELHRQMTAYTLKNAKALRDRRLGKIHVSVQFAGNPAITDLQQWLGIDIEYQPQCSGDLGDRLIDSFQRAFNDKASKVITIGTDCPGITPELLMQAFSALDQTEVVVGPALDGGYYLIGLRSQQPHLFQNIDWGTSRVLSQTRNAIRQQGLTYTELTPLADVDRPEDLPIWEAAIARAS